MGSQRVEWLRVAMGLGTELTPFSDNAAALLARALEECRARNHPILASEHVLWALLCKDWEAEASDPPRILPWIYERIGEERSTVTKLTTMRLEQRPLWAPMSPYSSDDNDDTAMECSDSRERESSGRVRLAKNLKHSLLLCMQFTGGPVYDPSMNVTHEAGLISTEALVAALLVEGKNVASSILQKLSKGRIQSTELLAAIGVQVEQLVLPPAESWATRFIDVSSKRRPREEWYPGDEAVPIESLPQAPTATSNWLIPGKLLLGTKPGSYTRNVRAEVESYLSAGVTTFVCLIGEYRTTQAFMKAYPSDIASMQSLDAGRVNFIHFRIRDMSIPKRSALREFVLELARRLKAGETLFLHCYGGHGRTGIVAILLLCVLYDMPVDAAREYVQKSTFLLREVDNNSGFVHHMPESPNQHRLMKELAVSLRNE